MFTKKDLKIGDVIVCHNGERFVMINNNTFVNNQGYLRLDCYNDKLEDSNSGFTVTKVYRPFCAAPSCFGVGFENLLKLKDWQYKVIYDKNTKHISLANLKTLLLEQFGCNVEIFDDETGEKVFEANDEIYHT